MVAVSGGPDSVALLRAVAEVRPIADGPLVVAHFNHRLRGEESDEDEAFVRSCCETLAAKRAGLAFRCGTADVAGQARAAGENLEKVARQLRYAWLANAARESDCRWVATGHTADDQAETVLHRLFRGTGLRGLRGILPSRPLGPGMQLVRPLLAITRAEVLAFLQCRSQDYRLDCSNLDRTRTRNRIRHELLPSLAARYNPRVVHALCRLASQAAESFSDKLTRAGRLLTEAECPRAGNILVFDQSLLAAAPRHRMREALRLAWQREGWPLDGMGRDDWERLASVATGDSPAADLPGGVRVCLRERVVQLQKSP